MTSVPGTPRAAAMIAAASLLTAFLAFALAPPASASGQFGIGAFGTYGAYKMGDLNDELITPLNDLLAASGSGLRMDKINNGFGFGGGLRWKSPSNILVAVDYERLAASSKVSDGTGSFELKVPANAVVGTVTYLLHSTTNLHFGFAGGLGYYTADGSATLADPDTSFTDKLKGHGIGFHAGAVMDVTLSDQLHLNVFGGWRQAKTTDLKDNDVKLVKSNGDDATLDWSGVTARVGLDLYFGATEAAAAKP